MGKDDGPTVLVVEDHEDTRDLIAFVLTEEGYEVTCAASTDQTLTWRETNPLIFTL